MRETTRIHKTLRRLSASLPASGVELVPEQRMSRAFGSVNVLREDKDVFDQMQAFWSLRKGRQLTQWETFTLLLADALELRASELDRARR